MMPAEGERAAVGDLTITIEDVTLADARSRELVRRVYPGPHRSRGRRLGPFAITGSVSGHELTLRITLDADGDGVVGEGDLLSTRRYPVSCGHQEIVVALKRVGG